jgi:uncharacterized RDD family membrane protein YckC
MMQCPSCSAPLVSGEARCVSCLALVNPPTQGNSALAARLVTPQSIEGFDSPKSVPPESAKPSSVDAAKSSPADAAKSSPADAAKSSDDAWRKEVLERVRKRRQVRTHALPLFAEGPSAAPEAVTPKPPSPLDVAIEEQLTEAFTAPPPRSRPVEAPAPARIASLDDSLGGPPEDSVFDLPLRPAEMEAEPQRAPTQSLVERSRPTLVGASGTRSLVGDMPLVEPSRSEDSTDALSRPASQSRRPASMNDRLQAAFIDLGLWSGMSVAAFYFASRIARTSIFGLGPAWQGLGLFGLVLASAYIVFFGGLIGATPGKIACGIHVRRHDGSSLGPLPSLGRGLLGIAGVALLGIGIWPAFWDKDRRTLHDRITDSRVTTV